MGFLPKNILKSIQGKTPYTLKIIPKVYLVYYAFQNSFILCYFVLM